MKIKKCLALIIIIATITTSIVRININVNAAWVTGDNIASQASLTAWPKGGDVGEPSAVVDGIIGSGVGGVSARWYAYTTDKQKAEDAYIEFEFPMAVTLGGAKIVSGQTNSSTSAPDTLESFAIQYYDGKNWIDAAEVLGNTLMTLSVRFPKMATSKKFRLASRQSVNFRIRELELYEAIDTGNNMIRLPELEESGYRIALETMANLGVIETIDSFDTEAVVTKEEFVTYILKLSGNTSFNVSNYKSSYKDVEISKYRDEIVYAELLGYIGRDGQDKFYPKKEITYTEAVQILLSMGGYDFFAEKYGGYPSGYLYYAKKTGLDTGITPKKNDFIVLGDVAQLLYNAISIPAYEYIGDDHKTTVSTGKTFLEYFRNVHRISGILYQSESFGIPEESPKGKVKIGHRYYNVGEADAVEYVGYSVNAWYQDMGGEQTLMYITPTGKNRVYNIEKKDISSKSDFSKVYYYDKNDNERNLNIAYNSYVFLNNELGTAYTTDLYSGSGSIRLIDNNNDGNIDVLMIDSVRHMVVASVSNNVIYDKLGGSKIDCNKAEEFKIMKDGYRCLVRDLKVNDVLSVSESSDGKKVSIIASSNVISGEIKATNNDKQYVKIDDKEYKYTDKIKSDLEVGVKADFYLDHEDLIVYVDNKLEFGVQYGLMFGFKEEAWTARTQIMDTNGKIAEYELAGKVIHNDVSKSASAVAGDSTLAEMQIIKYQLGKDGKLKRLYTAGAAPGTEPDRLSEKSAALVRYKNADNYYYYKPILNGDMNTENRTFILSAETVVFDIPYGATKEEYSVSKGIDGLTDGEWRGEVNVYDVMYNGQPGTLLLKRNNRPQGLDTSNRISVIIEKMQVYNNETEEVETAFRMYTNGKEETVVIAERCLYNTGADTFLSTFGLDYKDTDLWSLNTGDVIQYTTKNNKMAAIRILAKASDLKTLVQTNAYTKIQSLGGTAEAYIPAIETSFSQAYSGEDGILVIKIGSEYLPYNYPDTANVYIYNTTRNTVEKVTRDDIVYLKNSGGESKIFIRAYRKTVQDIIIVQ